MREVRRGLRRHLGQRGAVAIEFAFSLLFLIPLLLGTLDYGYYFWVGVNAVEAARAGGRAAIAGAGPGLSSCVANVANNVAADDTTARVAATAAVNAQMGKVFTAPVPLTTVVQQCINVTASGVTVAAWQIQVKMDFPPAVGFLNPWMPASSKVGCSGCIRYYSPTLVLR